MKINQVLYYFAKNSLVRNEEVSDDKAFEIYQSLTYNLWEKHNQIKDSVGNIIGSFGYPEFYDMKSNEFIINEMKKTIIYER